MTPADQSWSESATATVHERVRVESRLVAGVHTAMRLGGEPRAEAVVFVHGFLGSSADFEALMQDVSHFAYVVAPDMPNFGLSERSSRFACSVRGYADHLADVITELRIERVHLVLHDFGGPWGMQWAVEHPGAVASVTLFNVGVLPGYRWHKYARAWRTPVVGELMMACMPRFLFRALMQREQPRPFPKGFLDRVFDEIDSGLKLAGLELYRATPDLGALSVLHGQRLAALQLPALVIWGDADQNLPAKYAAEQAAYFAVQDLQLLEGCGHWPFIDEPARCSSLLCAFLRRQVWQVRGTPDAIDASTSPR